MSDENPTPTPDADAQASDTAENEPQDDAQDEPTEPQVADDTTDDTDELQGEPQQRRGVRERLATAEAEVEVLKELLTAQRQAVYDAALRSAGVDDRLMAASGHSIDSLQDENGVLHAAAITETATALAREVGIPRRPKPDPMLGRGTEQHKPVMTFSELLKEAAK